MREGYFIKKNKQRWEEANKPTEDPDKLAENFTYLIDDIGYAKSKYPNSKIADYINVIASKIYLSIYKNKKTSNRQIINFFVQHLPLTIHRHRKTLFFSFLFFSFFVALGAFASWQNPEFIRSILGNSYVDMTEMNIASGDPFNVYKDENTLIMFVNIAWNNIRVSFLCFAMGIFASIGTLYILFQNGIMLGSFEQMFFKHGLGVKSVLVVFIHGTLEIASIVIAGGAGLIMGNALLFPKTYSRLVAFKNGALDGVKIILSLIPLFLIAAFFESYITRYTDMPVVLSISILLGSLMFILWYFWLYPRKVYKKLIKLALDQQQKENKG